MSPRRPAAGVAVLGLVALTACSVRVGARPEPTPAPRPEPTVAPGPATITSPPLAASPSEPLAASRWLAAPGRVLSSEGAAFVATGRELLHERNKTLRQDGRLARLPGCTAPATLELRDVVDVAGTWPAAAFQLRASDGGEAGPHWLFRWSRNAWRDPERVEGPAPRMATVAGTAVLATRAASGRGYALRRLTAKRKTRAPRSSPTPAVAAGSDDCATILAELHGLRGNARGDLVAWGVGCDGAAVVEAFDTTAPSSSITQWPNATITALDVGPTGRMVVARRTPTNPPELLVHDGHTWHTQATVTGDVTSVADLGEEGIFVVIQAEHPHVATWRGAWIERPMPEGAGSPISLHRADDGSLWITTDTALLRTLPSAYEWTLSSVGCDVATVHGAPPYRYRDARPARWECPGGMFVHVATTHDDGRDVPAVWRGLIEARPEHIELGFEAARRRKGLSSPPPRPGVAIEPVVADELDAVIFGFALHGSDDITEAELSRVAEELAQLGQSPPRVLCAAPPGRPEAEVRRLAAEPTTVTSTTSASRSRARHR